MPGYDGTGPGGRGPMTGGGRGYCVSTDYVYGFRPGLGRGMGRGGGRGFRNRYCATGLTGWQRGMYGHPAPTGAGYAVQPSTAEQEKEMLQNEADMLEKDLQYIQNRIRALEQENNE